MPYALAQEIARARAGVVRGAINFETWTPEGDRYNPGQPRTVRPIDAVERSPFQPSAPVGRTPRTGPVGITGGTGDFAPRIIPSPIAPPTQPFIETLPWDVFSGPIITETVETLGSGTGIGGVGTGGGSVGTIPTETDAVTSLASVLGDLFQPRDVSGGMAPSLYAPLDGATGGSGGAAPVANKGIMFLVAIAAIGGAFYLWKRGKKST